MRFDIFISTYVERLQRESMGEGLAVRLSVISGHISGQAGLVLMLITVLGSEHRNTGTVANTTPAGWTTRQSRYDLQYYNGRSLSSAGDGMRYVAVQFLVNGLAEYLP